MKKILLLGAGLVSGPLVEYLASVNEFQLTVAARVFDNLESLKRRSPSSTFLELEVDDNQSLSDQIQSHDLVISLLPYTLHVKVAQLCLTFRKNLVTTSYVSDAMAALDKEAREKGLLFLNEIGVDPGIDHMSAMKIIDDVKSAGGKIIEFFSFCGGLPAPDDNDNPFGYKFSWSPRGVLLAGRNQARYLNHDEEIIVPGPELFNSAKPWEVVGMGTYEVYPNRDSIPYRKVYGLEGIESLVRGTFRNTGWSETLSALSRLGLLDDSNLPELNGETYAEMMQKRLGSSGALKAACAEKLELPQDHDILNRLEWLGLFSDHVIELRNPSYLDALSKIMQEKMPYATGEKDMVLMQHTFIVERKDGERERIVSTMVKYGIPNGDSAMARTVGLPAAIAAKNILQGKISEVGVRIPNTKGIYEPVMKELEEMKITFREQITPVES